MPVHTPPQKPKPTTAAAASASSTAREQGPLVEPEQEADAVPVRMSLHIPAITFIKVGLFALIVALIYVLGPLLLMVFLAMFLAVALNTLVNWLESRKVRHSMALTIVIGGLLTVLALVAVLVVPMLVQQVAGLSTNFSSLLDSTFKELPAGEKIRGTIDDVLKGRDWSKVSAAAEHFMSAGTIVLGGISEVVILLVIAIYLLLDGEKVYDWLLAFFSPLNRRKLRQTSQEVSRMIFGYVTGQITTSTLVTIYSFTVLSVLHVPAALLLALLAGLLDVIPVLGIIASTIPALLLAMSVSPHTALLVLGLYALFHVLEAYLIIPHVYGKTMRVSTLTVLLGLLAGSIVAGIAGALASLPIVASYGAVESIWLKPFLRDGVAEKHEKQKEEEFGEAKT